VDGGDDSGILLRLAQRLDLLAQLLVVRADLLERLVHLELLLDQTGDQGLEIRAVGHQLTDPGLVFLERPEGTGLLGCQCGHWASSVGPAFQPDSSPRSGWKA